jgi:FHS family L-fucose permease-like MFS transporter
MASVGGGSSTSSSSYDSSKNYTVPLFLMTGLFFMIGFITVMNDVLIPSLKGVFNITENWKLMMIQFCFFGAYGIMSIPAGSIITKIGYKKGLTLALSIMGVGLLMFVPAATIISYELFLAALFTVACGLTILQVAINPYIISLGRPETGASRLNLGGALNSTATFIGPIIGGALVLKPGLVDAIAKAEAVKGPYIVLALITIGIGVLLYFITLPKLETEAEPEVSSTDTYGKFKHLIFGSGAIFFYVGAEVAIGSLLILYLHKDFGVDEKMASSLVAYYWGSAMIGRFIGSALGQTIKANVMLAAVSIGAIALIVLSMVGFTTPIDIPVMIMNTDPSFSINFVNQPIPLAAFFLVLVGLLNSVMWPCIFPLGIAKLGSFTSKGSGLMCSMIVGGAFIPLFQGIVADSIGYKLSFIVCVVCYLYLLFFAVKGHKTDYLDEKSN